MYIKREGAIWVQELSEYLGRELVGEDFPVTAVSTLDHPLDNSIICVAEAGLLQKVPQNTNVLFLASENPDLPGKEQSVIVSPNPKLDFAMLLNEFFVDTAARTIHPKALIDDGASIGRNVAIGPFSQVAAQVTIGSSSKLLGGVSITGDVTVGEYCVIKDNAVIGSEGYEFVMTDSGRSLHVPHLGKIDIGPRVWIGAGSVVERAALVDTIIKADVKIDDLVNIGAGCRIGENTMITSGSVISKEAVIGRNCWIAPNATIKDGVTVADDVVIGMGSTVIKDITRSGVYAGSPATFLKEKGED
jgi:UDP-3-O-[3-hydroxymyristoyl] glucosamine N-acyltransferase